MALSITPIRPMAAEWTPSGACTRGLTAPPRAATRQAPGGGATTSTASDEHVAVPGEEVTTHDFRANFRASLLQRLGTALRPQRSADNHLVQVHVRHGSDAHAGWLEDVDGVDADAWPVLGRSCVVVPCH